MNIYDFYRMHLHTIEHVKKERQERRKIRKAVMEKKRRKVRDKVIENSIDFFYFEKGKLKSIRNKKY